MPTIINPIEHPAAYWKIILGKTSSPGVCQVSGFKRSAEWDVKKGKGTKGGTATLLQLPPAKGTVKFFLWKAEHWLEWASFRPLFKYDPTKKSVQAIDIYYPTLANIDVKSVVCEDIGAEEDEGEGKWSITVALLEYLPPPKKSAVSTPTGSTAGKGGAGKSSATTDPIADAQQKEIARLLEIAGRPG